MRVLIIIPDFPENLNNIKGGVQSALANLLNGFSIIGVNVRVITFCRTIDKEYIIKYSSTIEIVYCPEGSYFHLFNYISKNSFDVRKHVKLFNPDLVHFSMGGICLITKVFGLYQKKQLVTIHGISFLEARIIKNLRKKLAIYANEIIEHLLIPKNIIHISNYSLDIKGQTKKICYTIIPNAVMPIYFDIALKTNTDNRLIYIGAIDERKNILLLLQTLYSLVQNGKFYFLEILGDFLAEDYKNEILGYVKNKGLSKYIKFHGWVSQATVVEVLTIADILVVCSKQETLPMVIAEAMAAGKVVVSSDVGGVSEMITDGIDGFLFDLENGQKLYEILSKLYDNYDDIKLLEKHAKERAFATCNCEIVAKKTLAFYQRLTM